MKRKKVFLIIIYVIVLKLFFLTFLFGETEKHCNSLVVLNSDDINTTKKVVENIQNKGAKIIHTFPPNVLIGYIPSYIEQDLINRKNELKIDGIYHDKIDTSIMVSKYGESTIESIEYWNSRFIESDGKVTNKTNTFSPMRNDVRKIEKEQIIEA